MEIIHTDKKKRIKRLKKIVIISLGSIILFAIIIILFISPITKYLVEKYDKKYLGREVTMDWAYVNPFTGYIYFSNLKIYEHNNKTIFFAADNVNANFTMHKLLYKTYEIRQLSLESPKGIIIQNKKYFNFNDLIEKFSSKKDSKKTKAPVHFSILNIKINNGEFYYREKVIPIKYSIKNVTIESSGILWNVDTIVTKFSFLSGIGSGKVNGTITTNIKNYDYRLAIAINKLDLNIIEQYLNDLTNYGNFSAILDANIRATGNFIDKEAISTHGIIAVHNFHFGKNQKDDYASFDKLQIKINEMTPKKHVYSYDSVVLNHPYIKYEKYDYLDNLQTIFGKQGSNVTAANSDKEKFNLIIEIANYVKIISKNFFKSDYKVNNLAINDGDIKFNDFSTSEKFSVELNPLNIVADSIDKTHNRVNIYLKSGIKPYGNGSIALSINPKDSEDFDINYHFKKIPASVFNPYVIKYTSFPLNRGTIELKGKWNVKNGMIQSDNHIVIIDPRTGERLKNKDTKWIPVPLIMYFVRERGNVIDYEIPISGNLKNPKFHFKDVLFDALENIFVKPPTTAYQIQVKNTEIEIEKSLSLNWEMKSTKLTSKQEKFIKKMARFLVNNPEASITMVPEHYAIKEKEYILFFEAKKKYFLEKKISKEKTVNEDDSLKIDKMSVKDSLFIKYLNKNKNNSLAFSIQEKCANIIDSTSINTKFKQLNEERGKLFMSYFKEKEVEKQVKVLSSKNITPYNGFSFYKIEYKEEFPASLIKAYQKMNELNDEIPRKKFKKQRKNNKNMY